MARIYAGIQERDGTFTSLQYRIKYHVEGDKYWRDIDSVGSGSWRTVSGRNKAIQHTKANIAKEIFEMEGKVVDRYEVVLLTEKQVKEILA